MRKYVRIVRTYVTFATKHLTPGVLHRAIQTNALPMHVSPAVDPVNATDTSFVPIA